MKIIISPAKTFINSSILEIKPTNVIFSKKTKELMDIISKIPKEEYKKIFALTDNQVETIYSINNNIENKKSAINLYDGFVYKKLELNTYTKAQVNYLEKHIFILDALYGVLKPSTEISPYRLDMKSKINKNLYKYWENEVNSIFDDELIVNLASNEFSKLLKRDMLTISFKEEDDNKFKNVATYSKQARGLFLNYLIKNQITDIEKFKHFNEAGYIFNYDLSNINEYVFTRKKGK